ncbi:hypothetical protein M885DRAFT_184834 [Pelagophyceae sp. CCMP2097]|nr:hypothetical protein M885DRAFT_184834 [Pelagophyceae sp. CCMP2097]
MKRPSLRDCIPLPFLCVDQIKRGAGSRGALSRGGFSRGGFSGGGISRGLVSRSLLSRGVLSRGALSLSRRALSRMAFSGGPCLEGPCLERGLVSGGLVVISKGLVSRGLVSRGLVSRGALSRGAFSGGPCLEGPCLDGPCLEGPYLEVPSVEAIEEGGEGPRLDPRGRSLWTGPVHEPPRSRTLKSGPFQRPLKRPLLKGVPIPPGRLSGAWPSRVGNAHLNLFSEPPIHGAALLAVGAARGTAELDGFGIRERTRIAAVSGLGIRRKDARGPVFSGTGNDRRKRPKEAALASKGAFSRCSPLAALCTHGRRRSRKLKV